MVSPSRLFPKIIGVLTRNGREKWNQYNRRVGSMSLLNMALVCIHVGLGISHLIFHLPPWVWVIPFDLSSALLPRHHDLGSFDVKYCQIHCRATNMFKRSWPLQILTFLWFSSDPNSRRHYVPLCRVDDVGNTMAHLRSRSLPVEFSSLFRKMI